MIRLLLIGLLLASLAVPVNTAESKKIFEQSKRKLTALLNALEGTGERIYPEPRFYGANLWRYINGAAEAYHAYDFIALVLQRYRTGENELTLEIYDMGEPLNAFGIYAAERAPDLNFIPIGLQGYVDPVMLNFCQGSYYVKLSLDAPAQNKKLLKETAMTLADAMEEKSVMPVIYSKFPKEKRIAHTEQYLKKSALGYPFLTPAYQVSYEKEGDIFTIIICRTESVTDADARFAKLKEQFGQSGTLNEISEATFGGEGKDTGPMICSKQAKFVIILHHPPQNWQRWIEATRTNLKR
jgi:hypothetical protein